MRIHTHSPFASMLSIAALIGALSSTALGAPQKSDEAIAGAVTGELYVQPGVPGSVIDVSVTDGVATLDGAVDDIMAKERAADVAQSIRGVRSVVNMITVRSSGLTDQDIKRNVSAALIGDPATDLYDVSIAVSDGVVHLTGVVDSWQERDLAEKVAKTAEGVRAVENRVTVDTPRDRPDLEIKGDVVSALKWNTLIDHRLIDVSVDDGVVTLSGSVGSAAERERARSEAWVLGARRVDTDDLEIAPWAKNELTRHQTDARYLADEEIREAVTDALLYDPRVNSFDVEASINGFTATLTGEVDNLKAKRAAAQTARNTVGVYRVRNLIHVDPPEAISDPELASRVNDAIARAPQLDDREILVSADNGEVRLTGDVDDVYERAMADDVAAKIDGVTSVRNALTVQDPASYIGFEPFIDYGWSVYDFDWYQVPERRTSMKTDWEIREDVRDELWWSPFVDSDNITVTVDNGVVRLTGEVEDWTARGVALKNAYEGGAIFVDNDLEVANGPEQ